MLCLLGLQRESMHRLFGYASVDMHPLKSKLTAEPLFDQLRRYCALSCAQPSAQLDGAFAGSARASSLVALAIPRIQQGSKGVPPQLSLKHVMNFQRSALHRDIAETLATRYNPPYACRWSWSRQTPLQECTVRGRMRSWWHWSEA